MFRLAGLIGMWSDIEGEELGSIWGEVEYMFVIGFVFFCLVLFVLIRVE